MQVLIPAEQNYQVEDWVFERSPQELKQAVKAAQRKREMGEVRAAGACCMCWGLLRRRWLWLSSVQYITRAAAGCAGEKGSEIR